MRDDSIKIKKIVENLGVNTEKVLQNLEDTDYETILPISQRVHNIKVIKQVQNIGSINYLLKHINPDETLAETVLVLMYEVGDLAKSIRKIDEVGYRGEVFKALADIITQVRLICERLGFSFYKARIWGELDMVDKVNEYLRNC